MDAPVLQRKWPQQDASLIQAISTALVAINNCRRNGNGPAEDRWLAWINEVEKELPSGSGFDKGTKVDVERSLNADPSARVYFTTAFHFMDANGVYDGWEDYGVTVLAEFSGACISYVAGLNRNDIKEFIGDTFHHALHAPSPKLEW